MSLKIMDTDTGTYEVDEYVDIHLLRVLDQLLQEKPRRRITIDYGDVVTGKSWNERSDVSGYIGRSTGPVHIFILCSNKRSVGGGAILTGCVLSIRHANKKVGGIIYKRDIKPLVLPGAHKLPDKKFL